MNAFLAENFAWKLKAAADDLKTDAHWLALGAKGAKAIDLGDARKSLARASKALDELAAAIAPEPAEVKPETEGVA